MNKSMVLNSGYLKCPHCQKLVRDPTLKLGFIAVPCPLCGASGNSPGHWPGLNALKLLEVAFSQKFESEDDHRIGLLFLASAFEMMLADILIRLVKGHSGSEQLSNIVLDEWDTLSRRKYIFNKLSKMPLGNILNGSKEQQFLKDWNILIKQRNQLAHGRYYYKGSQDTELLRRLQAQVFHMFAKIHNDVEDQLSNLS